MTFHIKVLNPFWSLRTSLTILRITGFYFPDKFEGYQLVLSYIYTAFWYLFHTGFYTVAEIVYLFQIWGDIPQMTGTAFLLLTYMVLSVKLFNVFLNRREIQKIVESADDLEAEDRGEGIKIVESSDYETTQHLYIYILLSVITVFGWGASAEKNQLPVKATFPYDTTKSPAYELTYLYEVAALIIAAIVNVSFDTMVTSLIAQCRCRLKLLALSLRNLCQNAQVDQKGLTTAEQEEIIISRLHHYVTQHQATLEAVQHLQTCFSTPIFLQFTVSVIIICATAYQLAFETHNFVRFVSNFTYLIGMILQVFLYCYQGHHLSEESSSIADAVYESSWYTCSMKLKRELLVVMVRTRKVARISAAGLTTLSLETFMAIIKGSYSLFTVLQQVEM